MSPQHQPPPSTKPSKPASMQQGPSAQGFGGMESPQEAAQPRFWSISHHPASLQKPPTPPTFASPSSPSHPPPAVTKPQLKEDSKTSHKPEVGIVGGPKACTEVNPSQICPPSRAIQPSGFRLGAQITHEPIVGSSQVPAGTRPPSPIWQLPASRTRPASPASGPPSGPASPTSGLPPSMIGTIGTFKQHPDQQPREAQADARSTLLTTTFIAPVPSNGRGKGVDGDPF